MADDALSLEELLQRMQDQLAAASAQKAKLYADLEKANKKDPNEPAMAVLQSRLEMSEKVVEMRLKVLDAVNAEATPSELAETRLLMTQCEAVAMEISEMKSGSSQKTAAIRKDRPVDRRPIQRMADSDSDSIVVPAPSSSAKPKTKTMTFDAVVVPKLSASAAAAVGPIDWDNYSLPRPPLGTDWHDFYRKAGLREVAKAEARVKNGSDPRLATRPQVGSYGKVIVSQPPCERCVKHRLPCLFIDLAQPTANTPNVRCIVCRESSGKCAKAPTGTRPHKYADAVAVYHNIAISRNERPGLWMGDGVPELDILPPKTWEAGPATATGDRGTGYQRSTRNSMGS
ncbi:hypothetical protein C8F01DRAFT_1152243 [Mycena amicta]|nr:hypothetical protein C8F01DRAFT_1152243 [Mycena amicta]